MKHQRASRIIVTISNSVTDPTLPYKCVIHQLESGIPETKKVLCYGNVKKDNAIDKSHYQTLNNTLYQTKTMAEKGMSAKNL